MGGGPTFYIQEMDLLSLTTCLTLLVIATVCLICYIWTLTLVYYCCHLSLYLLFHSLINYYTYINTRPSLEQIGIEVTMEKLHECCKGKAKEKILHKASKYHRNFFFTIKIIIVSFYLQLKNQPQPNKLTSFLFSFQPTTTQLLN